MFFFERQSAAQLLTTTTYTEAWSPQALPADWAATRAAWNAGNALRTGVALRAFVLYLVALVIRTSPARLDQR